MNWKIKANVQNVIGLLPSSISYDAYYWVQRHFGALRTINPVDLLTASIGFYDKIELVKQSMIGSIVLEIGTGRRLNMPVAFWLMGAKQVITVDVNPYLKHELVKADLEFIASNKEDIMRLFGERLQADRFENLLKFIGSRWHLNDLFRFCGINYIAPGTAIKLPLQSGTVDFHVSYNVLEHIPLNDLKAILEEGNRVIAEKGLFVHSIDYSDHFSHSDSRISSINFLQYSDAEWNKIAGNRYMYMNRLRVDDICGLFKSAGHTLLMQDTNRGTGKDEAILELLRSGRLKLDQQFAEKSEDVLATTSSWIISQKNKSRL